MLVLKCIHCLWVILEIAIRGIKLDRQSSRGIDKEHPNMTRFIALKRVRRTAGSFFSVCVFACLFCFVCGCFFFCSVLFFMLVVVVFFVVDGVFCNYFLFQKISRKTLILWEGPSVFVCLCFLPEIMHTFFHLKRICSSLNAWCFMTVNLCLCCR